MNLSLISVESEKNFIMNPVNGGRPPSDRIVIIMRAGVFGERYEVIFRCPSVNTFRCSASKNMDVFITKYMKSMMRAALME